MASGTDRVTARVAAFPHGPSGVGRGRLVVRHPRPIPCHHAHRPGPLGRSPISPSPITECIEGRMSNAHPAASENTWQ